MDDLLTALSKIPAAAYSAIAAAIVTATVTLLATYLTNRSTQKRMETQFDHEQQIRNQEIRRGYLEEVYLLADRFEKRLVGRLSPMVLVLQGRMTYQNATQAMDQVDQGNGGSDFRRLEMLIDFYFANLREPYTQLLHARNEANKIVYGPDHFIKPDQKTDDKLAKQLLNRVNNIHLAAENFQKAIADHAAELVG